MPIDLPQFANFANFADEEYCYLTTRGRVTGNPHEIEIWFVVHENALYLMSGGGTKSDWVKNLLKDPHVTLRIAGRTFSALAHVQQEKDEESIRRKMADKYHQREADGSLSHWARTALVVGFTPQGS